MASESNPENPYEVPRSHVNRSVDLANLSATRLLGIRCLRFSLLFLLMPSVYNVANFNREAFVGWTSPSISMLYQLKWDFFLISIPAGAIAHGLAAGFYVPLFYRWYRLG